MIEAISNASKWTGDRIVALRAVPPLAASALSRGVSPRHGQGAGLRAR
jgi:hypothetical protein